MPNSHGCLLKFPSEDTIFSVFKINWYIEQKTHTTCRFNSQAKTMHTVGKYLVFYLKENLISWPNVLSLVFQKITNYASNYLFKAELLCMLLSGNNLKVSLRQYNFL